jgi:hypothetical protein
MQGTASNNAPSSFVVTPHFFSGSFVWLLSILLLTFNTEILLEHFFNSRLLAITHLLVLSWISTIIFGALYQLLPVILLCKLYSEKLALNTYVMLQIGSLGLFLCFWNQIMDFPLIISGLIVCLSILFFGINLFITLLRSTVKRIEKTFIITSFVWLGLTVMIGLILAINLSYPFLDVSHIELLKIHAHFGVIGWFSELIIGVASVLIPMFMLAHNLNKRYLTLSYVLINSALVFGALCKFFNLDYGLLISFILGSLGILTFLLFIYKAFRARVKKKLDIGMKKSMMAFFFVLLAIGFSIPIFTNILKLETAYFSILIVGFVSTLIMGQTFKTLPFIIWLKEYKSFVGKEKTPLPKDLYSDKLTIWQYRIHTLGFVLVLLGITIKSTIVLQLGFGLLTVGAILYVKNVLKIILHKRKHYDIINH